MCVGRECVSAVGAQFELRVKHAGDYAFTVIIDKWENLVTILSVHLFSPTDILTIASLSYLRIRKNRYAVVILVTTTVARVGDIFGVIAPIHRPRWPNLCE